MASASDPKFNIGATVRVGDDGDVGVIVSYRPDPSIYVVQRTTEQNGNVYTAFREDELRSAA